jgi:hypothetical protein
MLNFRAKHKDPTQGVDGWVEMVLILHVCYDITVMVASRRGYAKRDIGWF